MIHNKINIQYFKTPCGELILGALGDALCLCDWRERKERDSIDKRVCKGLNVVWEDTPILEETRRQLNEYFAQQRVQFEIPLLLLGTDFQKSVWNGLSQIRYGTTWSYRQLSHVLGNTAAIRAVANANAANIISIFVPCHRVVGSDGKLVGYAGGVAAKQQLLQLEGSLPF